MKILVAAVLSLRNFSRKYQRMQKRLLSLIELISIRLMIKRLCKWRGQNCRSNFIKKERRTSWKSEVDSLLCFCLFDSRFARNQESSLFLGMTWKQYRLIFIPRKQKFATSREVSFSTIYVENVDPQDQATVYQYYMETL